MAVRKQVISERLFVEEASFRKAKGTLSRRWIFVFGARV